MPDKLGPSTPAAKASRLSSIFSEVESIVSGLEHSPEIVSLIPQKYQVYVAVFAATVGTIQSVAHLFTHPDAQAVANSATGGGNTPAVSGGNTVPSATVEQTGEVTSAPAPAETSTQPGHESDVTLAAYSEGQAQLAAQEPLPSAEESAPSEEPPQTKRGK